MLQTLRIHNFAIIDDLHLDFSSGFTVITGETGSGKSILIDALCLALGGRAPSSAIRTGASSAEVEALFNIQTQPEVQKRLAERQLAGDDADTLVIRRVINRTGRSKVVLNGRLCAVATLEKVIHGLVEVSGQHAQQQLLAPERHRVLLDAFASLEPQTQAIGKIYKAYTKAQKAHSQLTESTQNKLREEDFIRFQLQEIEKIDPQEGEDEALAQKAQRLGSSERLRCGLHRLDTLLYAENGSAFDKVGRALAELGPLQDIEPECAAWTTSLQEIQTSLEDLARTARSALNRVESDPDLLDRIEARRSELTRLCRRFGGSIAEVQATRTRLQTQLFDSENLDQRLATLAEEVTKLLATLTTASCALSQKRKHAAKRFDKAVAGELHDMDLVDADFYTDISSLPAPHATGADEVRFLWSANPGEARQPLTRIASGGELSRVMLALRRVLGHRDLVSLYIFDEVDTGLGGKAAESIARKLQAVARHHQTLVITHLASIAARAEHHWHVHKTTTQEGRVVARIEPVAGARRQEVLAQMIDGAAITPETLATAHAMLARGETAQTQKRRSA